MRSIPNQSDAQDNPSDRVPSENNPGQLIARARKAHNLTPADLASRLRLDQSTIDAIEQNDYLALPGSTFVKGYLRSIAKELHLDAEPLLDAYRENSGEHTEPALGDFESRPPPQISSNSAVMKAMTYALGLLLLLLMVFWWRSNDQAADDTTNNIDTTLEDIGPSAPLAYEFPQILHSDEWNFAAEDPPETSTAESDNGAIDDLSVTIEITTTSEAWVEIADRTNDNLYYGMARASQPISLQAVQPVKFLIGNSPTVNMSINDTLIDLTTYSDLGVAKFSLDSGELNKTP